MIVLILMEVYLYNYSCPRWYGTYTGLRNLNIDVKGKTEEEVLHIAKKIENSNSGSDNCSISLIQKYKLHITNVKNYAALTCISSKVNNNSLVMHNSKTDKI